jgi:hypothetical protein
MQKIPKDYKPPEGGDFTTFEDGDYQVKSFIWTSVTDDDNKTPILISSDKIDGRFARLKWTLEDDTEGPPQSIRLYEMPLLALAFNSDVDLPNLPDETKAGEVSKYMEQIAAIVNNANATQNAKVSGGWANYIEGMEIPSDKFYYLRIINVISKSDETGELSWYRHDWPKGGHSNFIKVLCEILAEAGGKDSKFKGARFTLTVPYGIKFNEDTKKPEWETTDSGNWNKAAWEANRLYELTAPTMFEPFEPDNPRNLVPYWIKSAGGFPMQTLMGYLKMNTAKSGFKYYVVDLSQIEAVEFDRSVKSDDEIDVKARQIFADIMTYLAGEIAVEKNSFTPAGVEIAKKYLTPLKEQNQIKGAQIKDMTHEYIMGVVDALIKSSQLDKEQVTQLEVYRQKLSLVLVGMEDTLNLDEEIESPF